MFFDQGMGICVARTLSVLILVFDALIIFISKYPKISKSEEIRRKLGMRLAKDES
jgi:hypothetical protein